MATPHPAVRAAAILDALDYLDVFELGARARVLGNVPAPSREVLLSTSRSSWVGIEHDRYAVDAIVNLFGVNRSIQYWRAATSRLAERPLLKGFVSGMIALLGHDPGRVLGLLPKGWPLVYRELCDPQMDTSVAGEASLRFVHIAHEVRAAPNYFHSWHGTCLGMADLARMEGKVTFVVSADRSTASATFVWDVSSLPYR
ncbi:MAG: hypothetical protein RLZZ450_718 [Pseudomonadota bacterium]|jgi:hypothetical protein